MKVSVIIAAYNAEKYLVETLDSVTQQSMDEYEVIVVNDGSTDSTQEILESYQEKIPFLRLINKENGGPSSARNAALDIAQGEYIYFFDADDILETDALECLYDTAVSNKADLVIAKYDIFNRYKTFKVNDLNELVTFDTINKYDPMILWTFSLCNKLFKKSLIDQYHFRLPPISYSEDGAFLMEYVYHAKKITGLDMVIFHYRRMYDGETESITSSVSPSKIRDFITAHHLILKSAENSFLKDYPECSSIDEIRKQNIEVHKYLNDIIRKELQILIGQFYTKFWDLEEDIIRLIVSEIQSKLEELDIRAAALIQDFRTEISLAHLYITQEEVLNNAQFTAVLYGDIKKRKDFLRCLKSLSLQNLISLKIVLPLSMKEEIEKEGLARGNFVYEEAVSEQELFHNALDRATTPYIIFCDSKMSYSNNTLLHAYRYFIKSPVDFIAELIYHGSYGKTQSILINRMALDSLKKGMEYNPFLCMDRTLANKFFSVSFFRELSMDKSKHILDYFERMYEVGYYAFLNTGIVVFEGTEAAFREYVSTPESEKFIEECFVDEPITLNSTDIVTDPGEAYIKLQMPVQKTLLDKILKKSQVIFKHLRVKNQVLFFSIRKDGELEGNAKALYPYIRGKKVVFAKMLPHNWITKLFGFWRMMTSKVIVTDDYVRYLRHFPIRPEQRVIQLWHACGAFKKFGQRGSNISTATDLATHAQYNVVCVSGEAIRPIYADAFGINLKKVKALGCPRTDDFFNQELIQDKRQKIYEKYPDFKGKYIIIYAPTFRDTGKGRKEFHPALDFDKLSKELLPNQMFLICPHPVMKNRIVPKEYDNIRVMRDFSTNDLMLISDMMITDYSSVIFEYALLKKPIAFFCYDLDNYDRGFYLKYPDDLPGDIYETQDALTEYLRNPQNQILTDKYKVFVEKYMSACDGHSCERIAELINSYMEEK